MTATITAPETKCITLFYRQGSSDKAYQASIEPQGELFVVNFAFGRRGTILQTGTKTPRPVEYEAAARIYTRLILEKLAKGYTEGSTGTPYQHSDKQVTGILPQLLNPIEEDEVKRLLLDSAYCGQEKYDGKRVLVRRHEVHITGINRKGLIIGLPESLIQAAQAIPFDFVMDGECVGETLYAFDLLEISGEDLRAQSYRVRLVSLMNLLACAMQRNIVLVETAFSPSQKADLFNQLKRENKEGIVFKRLDAPCSPGRPNSGGPQLKHKFYATCSAVVANVNAKRSVEVRLLDEDGWQSIGNVTIPANFQVPRVEEVVDLRYLYAFERSHALFQPVYLGPRQDVEPYECVLSQLKYKAEEEDEA